MQSTVNAFLCRLPRAQRETRLGEAIFDTDLGAIEINVGPNGDDIQCEMENGAQLLIQKGPDGALWFYATASVRMDACFERCADHQQAVDKFLAIIGLAKAN